MTRTSTTIIFIDTKLVHYSTCVVLSVLCTKCTRLPYPVPSSDNYMGRIKATNFFAFLVGTLVLLNAVNMFNSTLHVMYIRMCTEYTHVHRCENKRLATCSTLPEPGSTYTQYDQHTIPEPGSGISSIIPTITWRNEVRVCILFVERGQYVQWCYMYCILHVLHVLHVRMHVHSTHTYTDVKTHTY